MKNLLLLLTLMFSLSGYSQAVLDSSNVYSKLVWNLRALGEIRLNKASITDGQPDLHINSGSSSGNILLRPQSKSSNAQFKVTDIAIVDHHDLVGAIKNRLHASGTSFFNGGNIGIGTEVPFSKFSIIGDLGLGSGLAAYPTGSNAFVFRTSGGGTGIFGEAGHLILQPRTSTPRSIIFATGTSTTERARIDDDGVNTTGSYRIDGVDIGQTVSGHVNASGTTVSNMIGSSGWTVTRSSPGVYHILHTLGISTFNASVSSVSSINAFIVTVATKTPTTFSVSAFNASGSFADTEFDFIIHY